MGHTAARQKELGAFYTPRAMADLLVRWSIRSPADRILDPSFGGYVFLEASRDRLTDLGVSPTTAVSQLRGIDTDPVALASARGAGHLDGARLVEADFFDVEPDDIGLVEVNIGNPPYVRYQGWDASASRAHTIAAAAGAPLTKLASLWAPFIIHGTRFLTRGGRMAQVLPAEILHAQYAAPVIEHLTGSFASVTLALFRERVFPGALQEVVLLFAEGYDEGPAPGIGLVHAASLADLDLRSIDGRGDGFLDQAHGLVTSLSPGANEIYKRLAAHPGVTPLADLAQVGIGIVTGANRFFLKTTGEIDAGGYDSGLFQPAVAKAADIQGAALGGDDLESLGERGRPTWLLAADADSPPDGLASIAPLIAEGERAELDRRYKCRIRSPWWALPLPRTGPPDALLTYMSDGYPRLVLNQAGAISTNTIHNVVMRAGHDATSLAVGFYNSLTLLSAELVGRSYGGGLLKLEPTEAGRLLVPHLPGTLKRRLLRTDRQLRAGDLEAVLDANDQTLLSPLGVTDDEISELRAARVELYGRRRARGRAPA